MKLIVVTGNAHKAQEVQEFFQGALSVEHVALDIPEHRHHDVRVIAEGKASYAFGVLHQPLIVDDTEFSIDALKGFPGPYAAYVLHTIGNEGILRLLRGIENRSAHFLTAIAYADASGIRVFTGRIDGKIVDPRGSGGFGYDPIFEWEGKTLADLPLSVKSAISHRARALTAFHDWFCRERSDCIR
ncbi:MAG: RdgB/HAM1 family non-canonical purine NTP pyrophosphatase [Methanomicrobiales archaeon]|nr:RdgB/HAM1 family non-canonical purine NTP pyrophosphatase [Methanomicrobiales archaeon]